jgi:AraC-like DNA-binding protein
MSAGHFSRQFRRAYGESPYSCMMTRRIERAMAGLPPCVAKQVSKPVRNREAPARSRT